MKSSILHIAAHHLMPLLLFVSIFYLFRGHNYPGGGFIGALIATAGLVFYALSHGKKDVEKIIGADPIFYVGLGLVLIWFSAGLSVLLGQPMLTGLWLHWQLPLLGDVHIGTPMLFDIGVYVAVIGVNLKIILTLAEE